MMDMDTFQARFSSLTGGYSYAFVDEVPERLNCQICAKPYRDPHLVVCCGKHYCCSCLTQWLKKAASGASPGRESCPHCRAEGKKFSHVVHKGLKSEVGELKMYCPHRKDGCEWIGQLGDYESHRTSQNGCDYERVQCPNKCTYSTWGIDKYLCRKDIENHVARECVRRRYLCEHCFRVDTYETITKQHYSECPDHPISCPNLGCTATGIKRKELNGHLKKCPKELVQCPFAEAGCKARLRRDQLVDHVTSSNQIHLVRLMGAYRDMKRRLENVENDAMKPKPKKAKMSRF